MASGVWPGQTPNDMSENERAYAALKLGRSDLLTFFDPIGAVGRMGKVYTSALSAPALPVFASGVIELSTGATSGSLARIYIDSPDGSNFTQHLRAGLPWFLSARWRVVTAPTTGTILSIGANNVANHLRMGVDFNNQGSNFMLEGPSGALMNSGVPFDTSFHTMRAWRTGGVTSLEIDGTVAVTGNVDILQDSGPVLWAANGTAANQAMRVAWWSLSAPSV